jgi:hypothetical protein
VWHPIFAAMPAPDARRRIIRQASRLAFPPDEIGSVLAMFRSQGELFQPNVSAAVSADPADTKFLQYAEAAQADYIVLATSGIFRLHSMERGASLMPLNCSTRSRWKSEDTPVHGPVPGKICYH